jgi:hypothetical protein
VFLITVTKFVKVAAPSDQFTYLSSIFDFGMLQFHISYYRYFVMDNRKRVLFLTEVSLNLSKKDLGLLLLFCCTMGVLLLLLLSMCLLLFMCVLLWYFR